MTTTSSDNLFRVSDYPLIASLAVLFPIIEIDRSNPRRACFLFERTEQLNQHVENYHRRQLHIEPQAFYQALRTVKTRLYADE